MKKALILLAIGLCLVAVLYAAPDFSGTWVRNAEKTTAANPAPPAGGGSGGGGGRGGGGMGGGEITIKMTAAEMTITRMMGQNESVVPYKLDGSEQTVNSGRGDLKYKAAWAGDVLTIAGTQAGRNGDAPYKMQYQMSADGKTLTTTSTNTTPNGEMVMKTVYDKK